MEASGSSASELGVEEKALKGLLDAFGSAFSLDEIASAYCKAGRNPDLAYEFLYETKGGSSTSTADAVNGVSEGSELSSESLCVNVSEHPYQGNGARPLNPKNQPVSAGTVSSIIGKEYIRTTRSTNGAGNATKLLKRDSKVLPVSELWQEEAKSNSEEDDSMNNNMVEFLFCMLGDGFKLGRDVIRQVLDACGYDMPKSVEKLSDLSTVTLDKRNKSVIDSADKSHPMKSTNYSVGTDDTASNSSKELYTEQNQRNNLGRDILNSLFHAPETKNEFVLPKVKVKAVRRSGIFGEAVVEPHYDSVIERKTTALYPQRHDEYDKDEESYLALRKGVKEYRKLMKDYYESAVEAFVKGDRIRARKLLEEGHFYHQKARDADEESSQMILETKNVEADDEMLLDLHEHGAKEAVRLLKCHLSSLSAFKYLKLILEVNEEDSSKGSRRRLVLKLLERESIKWVEGETAGTIRIQLQSINRKRLSFAKN